MKNYHNTAVIIVVSDYREVATLSNQSKDIVLKQNGNLLTLIAPNTTIAKFLNTADPDETAHNEPSHLDLQCLPSSL